MYSYTSTLCMWHIQPHILYLHIISYSYTCTLYHILYLIHMYLSAYRRLIEAEGTKDLLRPVLPALVGQYFRIMSDAENDAVLTSLQVYLHFYHTIYYKSRCLVRIDIIYMCTIFISPIHKSASLVPTHTYAFTNTYTYSYTFTYSYIIHILYRP